MGEIRTKDLKNTVINKRTLLICMSIINKTGAHNAALFFDN